MMKELMLLFFLKRVIINVLRRNVQGRMFLVRVKIVLRLWKSNSRRLFRSNRRVVNRMYKIMRWRKLTKLLLVIWLMRRKFRKIIKKIHKKSMYLKCLHKMLSNKIIRINKIKIQPKNHQIRIKKIKMLPKNHLINLINYKM